MVIYVTEDICERFGIVPADELRQPVRSMAETVLAREGADPLFMWKAELTGEGRDVRFVHFASGLTVSLENVRTDDAELLPDLAAQCVSARFEGDEHVIGLLDRYYDDGRFAVYALITPALAADVREVELPEAVMRFAELLEERYGALARERALPRVVREYTLGMELEDTDLTRRVSVTSGIDFYDLHVVLQTVFGWQDIHTHVFEAGKLAFGSVPDGVDLRDASPGFRDEDDVPFELVMLNVKELYYVYDLSVKWRVRITVEKTERAPRVRPPRLLSYTGTMAADNGSGPESLKRTPRRPVDTKMIEYMLNAFFRSLSGDGKNG